MKVGILTFCGVVNYGATLQAYALFNVLKTAGHDVELIDYFTSNTAKLVRRHLYAAPGIAFNNAVKQWRMNNFLHNYVKLTPKRHRTSKELKKCTENFDVIICGSDEIWNIHLPLQNFDFNYFLEFVSNETLKISYGASFGYTLVEDLGENSLQISQLLKSFAAISVRDENSLQIVRACENSAIKVLDPTFLCEYSKIISLPIVKRKYLLIYACLSSDEQLYVKEIAKYYGLCLIAVGYPCRIADYNYLALSPSKWLGYFAKASYIVSDFYHGVVFSIIFRKPFSAFIRDSKSNKIKDILKELNAENRIVSLLQMSLCLQRSKLPIDLNLMEMNLDYPKLQQMIDDSRQYLDRALSLTANVKDIKPE
jgi:Polysaccharide pyruvyl transferase